MPPKLTPLRVLRVDANPHTKGCDPVPVCFENVCRSSVLMLTAVMNVPLTPAMIHEPSAEKITDDTTLSNSIVLMTAMVSMLQI